MLELSAEHCQCSEIFCILRHYVTLPFDVSPFTNFSKLTSVLNVILFKNALGHNYNVATVTCISGVDLLLFFFFSNSIKDNYRYSLPYYSTSRL